MSNEQLQQELSAHLQEVVTRSGGAVDEIGPHDSFFERGILDSMSLLDFVVYLESRYGIKIPGEEIVPENFGDLASLTAYLGGRIKDEGSRMNAEG